MDSAIFSNNLITNGVFSIMSEFYKDIVLSPISYYKGEMLRALYLPNNSYWIFKRDNQKYKELTQLKITGDNTSLENINQYYNYVGDIKSADKFDDITYLIENGALKLLLELDLKGVKGETPESTITPEQEAKELMESLFTSLNNTMECDIDYSNDELSQDQIEFTTSNLIKELGEPEKVIWDKIQEYKQDLTNTNISDLRHDIIANLRNGKYQRKTQQMLAEYLSSKYGIILRKHTGDIYKLDNKGYSYLTHDDLVLLLKDDLGANIVHDEDIKKALGYISERLEPEHNIVKFKNCLFDMQKLEVIDPEKPIFTLIESPYNYNPEAKSTILKEFLYSSLARDTPEETEQAVKGVMQVIGYFFTSGNKYNLFPVCTGVSGGGKSVFTNILTNIFGKDKIADLSLQEMENNTHSTSSLANKHLNFIRDSDNTTIENNSFIKQLTGNEEIQVNPKHKDPYILPKEEVPKTMMICNSIPLFKVYEQALIERLVIIEFLVKFRGTPKQDPELEDKILSNPEEIEWLIYNSIQAYASKEANKEQFILKITDSETRELIDKHTNPLNHLVRQLILKHDPIAYETEKALLKGTFKPVIANDLASAILYLANTLGLDIPLDRNEQVSKRKLIGVLKTEFDLWEGEIVQDKNDESRQVTRNYTTQPERIGNKTERVYPNLIATPLYFQVLQELENIKELNQ